MAPVPREVATSHFVCRVPVLGQQVLLWKLVTHSCQVSPDRAALVQDTVGLQLFLGQ